MPKIVFNDTAEFQPSHPVTGEPLTDDQGNDTIIVIYGTQSEHFRAARLRKDNRITTHRGGVPSAEKIEGFNLDMLAECTLEFRNLDLGDGVIDTADARKTYRGCAWLRNQVDEAMAENARFLAK